jgi:hypothetical protein
MSAAASLVIDWSEQGYMPDAVIRSGIRGLLRERLTMRAAPIAPVPHKLNEQHWCSSAVDSCVTESRRQSRSVAMCSAADDQLMH